MAAACKKVPCSPSCSKKSSVTIVRREDGVPILSDRPPPGEDVDRSFKSDSDLPPIDTAEARDKAAVKLRVLMDHFKEDESPSVDVQPNLLYAIQVLESAYMDEYRRLKSMEDELDLLAQNVSRDVREWLEITFTRTTPPAAKAKRSIRGVAQGIRDTEVDRAHRQHFPNEVARMLEDIDNWSFDVFAFNQFSKGEPVKYLGCDLFIRYGLVQKFKIPSNVLQAFLERIEKGYVINNNPYHNNIHSVDVTQCFHYMLCNTGITEWLSDLDVFAMLVAALIHDFEHTGTTNAFHISSNSEIALVYNDKSVLENFHISETFKVLQDDRCNIIKNLSRDEYRDFRSLIIECVLATDMTFHFQHIKNIRSLLSLNEPVNDRPKVLGYLLHCCDIAHPAKDWNLHNRWVDMLLEEFFEQGDRELALGLPFSPMCDRKNTDIPHSQVTFIEVIVEPTMRLCSRMLESILSPNQAEKEKKEGGESGIPAEGKKSVSIKKPWVECLKENKRRWKQKQEESEAQASVQEPPADG